MLSGRESGLVNRTTPLSVNCGEAKPTNKSSRGPRSHGRVASNFFAFNLEVNELGDDGIRADLNTGSLIDNLLKAEIPGVEGVSACRT